MIPIFTFSIMTRLSRRKSKVRGLACRISKIFPAHLSSPESILKENRARGTLEALRRMRAGERRKEFPAGLWESEPDLTLRAGLPPECVQFNHFFRRSEWIHLSLCHQ